MRVPAHLGGATRISRNDDFSEALRRVTGWDVIAVAGLILEPVFFRLLANRRLPVTSGAAN